MPPATAPTSTAWFAIPQPRPQAQVRLFAFPHAGGGNTSFRPWFQYAPPSIEWCLLSLPGREQRLHEPSVQRLDQLVALLAQAIVPFMTMPSVFWGHSLGSFVAFELARELVRQGRPGLRQLIVSGQRAPHLPHSRLPLQHLPDQQFLREIQQRYNAIPDAILQEPELLQLFLPAMRADAALLETYTYQEGDPLTCPISAFGGTGDRMVSAADIEAWGAQTRGRFSARMFPGGHFFLNETRGEMLRAIAQDLAI